MSAPSRIKETFTNNNTDSVQMSALGHLQPYFMAPILAFERLELGANQPFGNCFLESTDLNVQSPNLKSALEAISVVAVVLSLVFVGLDLTNNKRTISVV